MEIINDVFILALMVRPLGEFLVHPFTGTKFSEPKELYSCVHFNGEACEIYDRRPAMCRNFPYGRKCEYPGCAWDEARELPVETPTNSNTIDHDVRQQPTEE